MRKSSKRKVRPARNPIILPLVEREQQDLALKVHLAASVVTTVNGCNQFTKFLFICVAAMQIAGTHDNHSRALLRTACMKLDDACFKGVVPPETESYCKTVAFWLHEWIKQGRITHAAYDEAVKIEKFGGAQ